MERSIAPYERYGRLQPESDAKLQEYIFKVTDTLSGIAQKFYRDWRLWRLIADRNEIIDVRQIAIGTRLLIPQKPLQKGRFEST